MLPSGLHLALHLEAIPSRGEDAEPLLVADADRTCRHLAVFDGMGGAGARATGSEPGHTEAYLAARLARDVLRALLTEEPMCSAEAATAAEEVATRLREAFGDLAVRLLAEAPAASASRVVSNLIRTLPTTFALASVIEDGERVLVRSLWAGDSRVYALTPEEGLLQLTCDHCRYAGDALTSLYRDSPLANFVSADRPFYVDAVVHELPAPAVVVAATDGCFGYWPSPMHFEEVILDSLCRAESVRDWRADLEERVRRVTADDASLVGVTTRTPSLGDLAAAYRDRLARLQVEFLLPGTAAIDELRERWDRYRPSYESRLHVAPSSRPEVS